MRSRATAKFWKFYGRLPQVEQKRARSAYEKWKANPFHPSLHFKQVDDEEPIYSARVSEDFRVLDILEGDLVIWYWIGSHDDYLRMLKRA